MNASDEKPAKVEKLDKASATFKRKFNTLCDAVAQLQKWAVSDRAIVGSGLRESQTPKGRKWDVDSSGSGDALDARWWSVAVDGQPMYAQFNSSVPVSSLPTGASVVNP